MQVAVHEEQVAYLREHRTEFPGVDTSVTYLRRYNTQALLAHVLGYVGELTPAQLADIKKHYGSCALPRAKELNVPCAGDRVGQTGVEKTYDKYLRGRSGEKLQRVNSVGAKVDKTPVVTAQPMTGAPVQLTIDISLQRAAERALAVRHPPRACRQPLARERRRDRGDEPQQRRDPRDGVRADLQARHLRRPNRSEEARAAPRPGDREEGQLPRPEPRDRGPLSARLDVQAGDRARRDAGAADLPVPDAPVHAEVRGARAGLQELGSVRRTSR